MIPQVRYFLLLIILFLTGYFARNMYIYYFHQTAPLVTITGFEQDQGYSGDITGTLKGSSPYKISYISMWIDDTIIHQDFKINKKQFEFPILIPEKSKQDGKHTIKFEIVDGTKHHNTTVLEKTFYIDNIPLQAALIPLASGHKVYQGRCLYVQLQVNKPIIRNATITMLQNSYQFVPESKNSCVYEVLVPIDCEQDAGNYPFTVTVHDRLGSTVNLEGIAQILPFNFKRKTLNITGNKLQSELEFTQLQEQDLEEKMEQLANASKHEKLWSGCFEIPIAMKGITTDFGVVRTSQERGRKIHKALDLIADPKSVIWASNHGIVVLKDRYTHTGNTVVIDHGCGILSLYCHLSDYSNIEVGQKVKKGHPLGHMGMTGYASGDHLHWEIRVNNVGIDPIQLTQKFC